MLSNREVDMSLSDYCYWTDLEAEWEHDDMYFQLKAEYGDIIRYSTRSQYYYVAHENFRGIQFLTYDEALEYAYEYLMKE